MTTQQLNLLILRDPGAATRPGSRPGRRGRGATPIRRFTVELPEPNPVGRRRLMFAYRPLRAWSGTLLAKVHDLFTLYFMRIGGFRQVRDATVRQWYAAIADGVYTVDELRWAIGAKATSLQGATPAETREKRRYACGPGRFIALADYWIEQSPEAQAAAATAEAEQSDIKRQLAANAEAAAKLRKAATERRTPDPEPRPPAPEPRAPSPGPRALDADSDCADLPPFLREAIENEAFYVHALELLTPRRRRIVERQLIDEGRANATLYRIIREHGGGAHLVKGLERYLLVEYALAAWPELRPRVFAAAGQPQSQVNGPNQPAAGATAAACGVSQAALDGRLCDDPTVFNPASTAGFTRCSGSQTGYSVL